MRISSFPTPTPFSYFFVGFWGTSFPSNVRNTSFIYRGGELERFEDFSSFLKVSQSNVIIRVIHAPYDFLTPFDPIEFVNYYHERVNSPIPSEIY